MCLIISVLALHFYFIPLLFNFRSVTVIFMTVQIIILVSKKTVMLDSIELLHRVYYEQRHNACIDTHRVQST